VRPTFALFAMLALAGCASTAPRLAASTYGCMQAVVREKLPADLPDKRAHCIASGLIARYCSVSEAYLAGAATELRDLLNSGNAEWADWQADRAGVACARNAETDDAVARCCVQRGY
jgi:hypothetical protein